MKERSRFRFTINFVERFTFLSILRSDVAAFRKKRRSKRDQRSKTNHPVPVHLRRSEQGFRVATEGGARG